MGTRAAALAPLLLCLIAAAAPAADDARTRIDRVVRAAGMESFDLHRVPDLTEELNALLAMEPDEVFGALREALELAWEPGSVAQHYQEEIEDLARMLVGGGGFAIRVAGGAVFVRPSHDTIVHARLMREQVPLEEIVGPTPKLRKPVVRDADALLAFLRGTDAREFGSEAAGLALGDAARADPVFAHWLLETEEAALPDGVLAVALERMDDPVARERLWDQLVAATDIENRSETTARFFVLGRAIRAGDPWEAEHLLLRFLGDLGDDATADLVPFFLAGVGGEVAVRAHRGDEDEVSWLDALIRKQGPRYPELNEHTVERLLLMDVDWLTLSLLWPFDGMSTAGAALFEGGKGPGRYEIKGLGGYPDPIRLGDRFADGRFELAAREGYPGESVFSPSLASAVSIGRSLVFRGIPATGVRVTARRLADSIRVRVENASGGPLCLALEPFRYATAREVTWGDAPTELRLTFGRIAPQLAKGLYGEDEDAVAVLAPGEGRTFAYRLAPDLPADRPVYAGFLDTFDVIDGDPPAPRIRAFPDVLCAPAPPLTDADRAARKLVDRILFAEEHDLLADGTDLTATVNELIALGDGPVWRALRDALDPLFFRDEGNVSRAGIRNLALLLSKQPRLEPEGYGVREVAGHAVLSGERDDDGGWGGNRPWEPPPDLADMARPKLREPLKPDPSALLAAILDPEDPVADLVRMGDFRAAAGLSLGAEARSDPALAPRILAALEARSPLDGQDPRSGVFTTLAIAAGRLGTSAARAVLLEKVREHAADWNVHNLAAPVRLAGAERELADLYRSLGAEARVNLGLAIGGDETFVPALAIARGSPSPETLHALTQTLGFSPGLPSASILRPALEFAIEQSSSPDPEVSEAAVGLVLALVWPYTRGWPAPVEQARRLLAAIDAGRIRIAPEWPSESAYPRPRCVEVHPLDDETPRVRLTAERDGDVLRLVVRNDDDEPYALNPIAFEFGSGRVEAGQVSIERQVQFGSVPLMVRAADLVVIEPGAERTFTMPLPKDLDPAARFSVSYRDDCLIDGDPPAPVIERIEPD